MTSKLLGTVYLIFSFKNVKFEERKGIKIGR